MTTYRIDVTADGEPLGSVTARTVLVRGRQRVEVTLGDTTGESHTYLHRRLMRMPNLDSVYSYWDSYVLNVAQSAFATNWWRRKVKD